MEKMVVFAGTESVKIVANWCIVAIEGFARSCVGAMITSIDTHQIINKGCVTNQFTELTLPQPPRHHKVLVVVGALLRKHERSVPFFFY